MKKILFTPIFVLFFLGLSQGAISQEIGQASYYADSFQNRKTASGEKYDRNKMTCAHNTYPFGTLLKVTRLDNKKSVIVKVNDRGPNISGRIVDVSWAAAKKLDLIKDGLAKVSVEVYKPNPGEINPPKEINSKNDQDTKEKVKEVEQVKKAKSSQKVGESNAPKSQSNTTPSSSKPRPQTPLMSPRDYNSGNGLYSIQITRSKGGFATQVGSYSNFDNTMRAIADLQAKGFTNILLKMETPPNSPTKYKLLLGLRDTRESAEVYRKNLQKKYKIKGFITEVKP